MMRPRCIYCAAPLKLYGWKVAEETIGVWRIAYQCCKDTRACQARQQSKWHKAKRNVLVAVGFMDDVIV